MTTTLPNSEIIQEKQDEGKTIIFSTHQMEQVERLCNNICLIDRGSIVVEGSLKEIRKKHSSDAVEVRFSGDIDKNEIANYFKELEVKENTISGVLSKNPNQFLKWIWTIYLIFPQSRENSGQP